MIVTTSYFSNWRKFKDDQDIYSIVRLKPKWSKYKNIIEFAPSTKLLRLYKDNKISEIEYIDMYRKEQEKIDHLKILNSLKSDNIVLICYEKTEDFCHRHILLKMLEEKGVNVKYEK